MRKKGYKERNRKSGRHPRGHKPAGSVSLPMQHSNLYYYKSMEEASSLLSLFLSLSLLFSIGAPRPSFKEGRGDEGEGPSHLHSFVLLLRRMLDVVVSPQSNSLVCPSSFCFFVFMFFLFHSQVV